MLVDERVKSVRKPKGLYKILLYLGDTVTLYKMFHEHYAHGEKMSKAYTIVLRHSFNPQDP